MKASPSSYMDGVRKQLLVPALPAQCPPCSCLQNPAACLLCKPGAVRGLCWLSEAGHGALSQQVHSQKESVSHCWNRGEGKPCRGAPELNGQIPGIPQGILDPHLFLPGELEPPAALGHSRQGWAGCGSPEYQLSMVPDHWGFMLPVADCEAPVEHGCPALGCRSGFCCAVLLADRWPPQSSRVQLAQMDALPTLHGERFL